MKKTIVPLELINLHDNGFHLLVEVVVFGQSFKAVLDTGASKTVLDIHTVNRFITPEELIRSEHLSTGLGTSSMESHILTLSDFHIGDFHIEAPEIAVIDLSTISAAYSTLNLPPVIGVVGGDILRTYHAIIDYKKLSLKLFS